MIGIICAMQIEADGIIALMENKKQREIAKMTFTSGTLNGKELVVVVCGVGKVNAAMCSFAMIQNYKPDCIINSGVAGSVSEKVSVGDIVVATNADSFLSAASFQETTRVLTDAAIKGKIDP